jgi:hypothetical protein
VTAAPDYCEPIVGWRLWSIVTDGARARLAGHICPAVWHPGSEFVAACDATRRELRRPWRVHPTGHAAPAPGCTCGVHAMDRAAYLATYVPPVNRPYAWMRPLVRQAIGRVSLWGDVVEGARGWRASRAYPAELWLPAADVEGDAVDGIGSIAADLADYGVPVQVCEGTARDIVSALTLRQTADGPARPMSRPGGRGSSSSS